MILWTVANQSPLSMGFPRQEYWSGQPFPSPRDLSYPGIKLASPALAGGFFTTEPFYLLPPPLSLLPQAEVISVSSEYPQTFSVSLVESSLTPGLYYCLLVF